jgi:trimeric autotransporter adhesin
MSAGSTSDALATLFALATIALVGCLRAVSETCADGSVCGGGLRCGLAGEVAVCVADTCGNDRLDPGEACDDGNTFSGDGCPASCGAPCGDGVLDPGEACDDGADTDGDGCDRNCTVTACGNAIATDGEVCDDGNDVDGDGCDRDCSGSALAQQAYVKATSADYHDDFGAAVALSGDGATLAVGAPGESSAATGVDGDPRRDDAPGAGAVYVLTRTRARWVHRAYLKASNASARDGFGCSVALSADGNTLAVGACGEDGSDAGGDPDHDGTPQAGAVYVFARSGASWRQTDYLKAPDASAGDRFGSSVALSADGATLAVGAPFEASAAAGVDGDRDDDSTPGAGAVYVLARGAGGFQLHAYVKANTPDAQDGFGARVALSSDGAVLAVAAPGEDSSATGIGEDLDDDAAPDAGAVYVFSREPASPPWRQDAYVKAANARAGASFGSALALSADGKIAAVGSSGERSMATGVGGDPSDGGLVEAGAAYVLQRDAAGWRQRAYLKASNTNARDAFGRALALDAAGAVLLVGGPDEDGAAVGVGGVDRDNSAHEAGAAYRFARTGEVWRQTEYVKASNAGADDFFASAVAVSGDGATLAVGGPGDDSLATGVDGDQRADYTTGSAGAVYVFH